MQHEHRTPQKDKSEGAYQWHRFISPCCPNESGPLLHQRAWRNLRLVDRQARKQRTKLRVRLATNHLKPPNVCGLAHKLWPYRLSLKLFLGGTFQTRPMQDADLLSFHFNHACLPEFSQRCSRRFPINLETLRKSLVRDIVNEISIGPVQQRGWPNPESTVGTRWHPSPSTG